MMLLVFVVILVGLSVGLAKLSAWRGTGIRPPHLVVALIALLPFMYGGATFLRYHDRADLLRFDYVGKRLRFSDQRPVTIGGLEAGAEHGSDLFDSELPPDVARIVPVEPGSAAAGVAARLLVEPKPAPFFLILDLVTGVTIGHNRLPLSAGDVIEIRTSSGKKANWARFTFQCGLLECWLEDVGGKRSTLVSWQSALAAGSGRVVLLRDPLSGLEPPAGANSFSFFHKVGGAWHLTLREDDVRIAAADASSSPREFQTERDLPREFELASYVVGGPRGDRSLRKLRQDRVVIGASDVRIEIEPQRRAILAETVAPDATALALVVPSAFDARPMIEFSEPSPDFNGLSVGYGYSDAGPRLQYLTATVAGEFGDVFALGQDDQMLVRLDRDPDPPWRAIGELALLSAFLILFLVDAGVNLPWLGGTVGAVGLLLANRLLFAYKAASRPPNFDLLALEEARLALWIVPAFLLGFSALARVVDRRFSPSHRGEISAIDWSLAGLVIAGVAAVTRAVAAELSTGKLVFASAPLIMAVLVWIVRNRATDGRGVVAPRLMRLHETGIPWLYRAALGIAAAIFVVRLLAAKFLGMPEAIRWLSGQRLLLWSALQLPASALLVGLTLHLVNKRVSAPSRRPLWSVVTDEVSGILTVWLLIAIAFGAVAIATEDLGLMIVHALAPVLSCLVLFRLPTELFAPRGRGPRRSAMLVLLPPILALLPVLLIAGVNRYPLTILKVRGLLSGEQVNLSDLTTLDANDAQLFRLIMLANPDMLQTFGVKGSERLAYLHATRLDYAKRSEREPSGYLSAPIPSTMAKTYLSDIVPMVFVLPELGNAGLVGLALLYVVPVALLLLQLPGKGSNIGTLRSSLLADQGSFVGLVSILAFAIPGIYMILANLNFAMFTGKSCSLLALDSLSDLVENGLLLGFATCGFSLAWRRP